jgi:hypothetical protein
VGKEGIGPGRQSDSWNHLHAVESIDISLDQAPATTSVGSVPEYMREPERIQHSTHASTAGTILETQMSNADMSNADSYKRGQVAWAIWQFFLQGRQAGPKPPKVFLTRIKRLLELDRGENLGEKTESPYARFAFADAAPEGKGTDVDFRPFNAFCLAVALDLLDTGFKQSEIVFLLRHIRDDLETWFERILLSPPSQHLRIRPQDRPEAPTLLDAGGREYADCRVFVVINKIEIKEIIQVPGGKKLPSGPLILEPVYCRGIEALRNELHRMGADKRKAMIIEISHAAADISRILRRAPVMKRGRG